ncbi:hypothetical protein J1614_007054 [Plenodomus biglobosus]|nr:hypothetical protein J1614_007054 [Plenodomus biglobosus]
MSGLGIRMLCHLRCTARPDHVPEHDTARHCFSRQYRKDLMFVKVPNPETAQGNHTTSGRPHLRDGPDHHPTRISSQRQRICFQRPLQTLVAFFP